MKFKLLFFVFVLISISSNAQNQEPKPVFKIGLGMSRVWAPEFRNAQNASIGMSDFSQSKYVIQEFTVTVLSNETKTFKTVKNLGSKFSDDIIKLFSYLKSDDTVMVEGIVALDPSGETVHLNERIFRIR